MDTPPRSMPSHNNLHALLFQATSAEYMVLCLQTYQLARHSLLARLKDGTYRNPAVILDLDETVLDNSAYQAWQVATGTNYHDASWAKWCKFGMARAVPGAVEFVRFATSHGVTPIFITSRINEKELRAGTVKNLAALELLSREEAVAEAKNPEGDPMSTRLFMKKMAPVKWPRPDNPQEFRLDDKFDERIFCQQVRGYEIILSIGDNLADYAEYYGRVVDANGKKIDGVHPNTSVRRAAAIQDAPLFGRDFVLMPNATYGGWLRAFEANQIGAGDEIAFTDAPVREGIKEPQTPFTYKSGTETKTPRAPKFSDKLGVWDGNQTVSARAEPVPPQT